MHLYAARTFRRDGRGRGEAPLTPGEKLHSEGERQIIGLDVISVRGGGGGRRSGETPRKIRTIIRTRTHVFVCFCFCQNGFIFAGRLRGTGARGRGWSEWGGVLGEAGGADQSVSAPIKTLD